MKMMRSVAVSPSETVNFTKPTGDRLLEIDSRQFQGHFNQTPFTIRHQLADHPLFAMPRLLDLARVLPADKVEYNAGALPVSCDAGQTPRNGLSVEETIRRIAECKSWMVLKYVETDPEYRALLHRCLAEVAEHSESIAPGMCQAEGFIFLTSPGSVTPYHMDPEHNFLLQVRGPKEMHVFAREVVAEEELERFYGGAHRNMAYKEEYQAKEEVFVLQPGDGLHVPVCAPHWVKNGPEVSVSFSITFRTPDLDRRGMMYNVNAYLRSHGLRPTPVGVSPWRDRAKCQAYRAWRKARRLFGAKVS